MRTHLVASLGLTLCAALGAASGCASDGGPAAPGEELGAQGGAMFADTINDYYAASKETGDCRIAPCGGYTLARLNTRGTVSTVRGLDFSSAGFDAGTIHAIEDAPAGELVLYGAIGYAPSGLPTGTFVVVSAYRGMPGIRPPPDDAFYVVHDRKPPIECLVAPCDNEIADLVETDRSRAFTTVSVARASAPYVDQSWLADRVLHHGAVVAGHFRDGAKEPGGYEQVLDAGQVFVELPDRGGPCLLPHQLCAEPSRPTYTRDVDRCLVFQGCIARGPCLPGLPPRCAEGYALSHWPAAGPSCVDYVCDPAFLAE
jgi:hypothetical protein